MLSPVWSDSIAHDPVTRKIRTSSSSDCHYTGRFASHKSTNTSVCPMELAGAKVPNMAPRAATSDRVATTGDLFAETLLKAWLKVMLNSVKASCG